MLESDPTDTTGSSATPGDDAPQAPAPRKRAPRKAAKKAAVPAPHPAEVASAGAEVGPSAPTDETPAPPVKAARKRAPRKATAPTTDPTPAADPAPAAVDPASATDGGAESTDGVAPAKKASRRRATKAAPATPATPEPAVDAAAPVADGAALVPDATPGSAEAVFEAPAPAKKPARKRVSKKAAAAAAAQDAEASGAAAPADGAAEAAPAAMTAPSVLFIAPQEEPAPAPRRRRVATKAAGAPVSGDSAPVDTEPAPGDADITVAEEPEDETADPDDVREAAIEQASGARRRRRRGRRGRGGAARSDDDSTDSTDDNDTGDDADGPTDETASDSGDDDDAESPAAGDDSGDEPAGTSRRRRRRRRSAGGGDDDSGTDDPPNTVTHVRERAPRGGGGGGGGGGGNADDDGVKGVKGSTRLEAKRQRRRDGRDTTRRRAPILSEAEFLARREAVNRVMAVRQNGDRTQIAVLEDDVLVEHYVTRASSTSYVGNVYLGRVQNVLPSMEAAFIDIGKGRNGVLYAGEVNWDAAGLDGKSRTIEHAMKSGDAVLVQVTKDPIGHKGARLTSQVSLPGRFLVYVPGGGMTGISRRLPDTERHRLKAILKKIVPDEAGVIVRTAAEGASEEDLTHDVERLQAQWEAIQAKAGQTKSAPTLVHGEPDLAIRVVRDVFNEDFASLVVQGDDAWSTISEYLGDIAPDLAARASRHVKDSDLFHDLRVDEQLMKALDRKVWLPSGGSLVIDRTEAMTVIDVNTGKFVGSGGNLEQTVTRNNLEAAEEVVRQLRLRDVGGIVVIDFIDMVLESNRDLVLRRLTECLGRDRTKHQVAEVTSLGLVQMTRKRVGEGLLEAFSERCEHCGGRGLITHTEPVDQNGGSDGSSNGDFDDDRPKSKRRRGGRGSNPEPVETPEEPAATEEQRRAASAAIAAIHRAAALEKAEAAAALEATESGIVDRLANGLVAAAMNAENSGHADEPTPESDQTPEPTPESDQTPEPTPEPDPTQQAVAAVQAVEHVAATPTSPAAPDTAGNGAAPAPAGRRRRRAASRPAGPPVPTT